MVRWYSGCATPDALPSYHSPVPSINAAEPGWACVVRQTQRAVSPLTPAGPFEPSYSSCASSPSPNMTKRRNLSTFRRTNKPKSNLTTPADISLSIHNPTSPRAPAHGPAVPPVSYTHLRAHETVLDLVCRLLLEKKKKKIKTTILHKKNVKH
eukprot:TRINITY_DN458_c0_g1_i3.p1 TRINITY_DN458_c0_g1~~TRINITY_DN458_c0_g1_i3.p1  ORF type:complete len:153 (-),score=15.98 TRINITY_DN458_c0_g1_i3:31-489(-)